MNFFIERFVNVSDADKKGLPKVVASLYISTKSREDVKLLCNLIYQFAYEIRTVNRKSRLLLQKVPASFVALEKVF